MTRKLWRDLWAMRGQALAIAAVIVSGVATLVMSLSAYDSLYSTQQTYYRDYRFAEVFARLKRAPERTAARIGSIPGVDDVETRVVADANLEVEGFTDPIVARLVSLPDTGQPAVNRIYVRRGRLFDPARSDEVLVSEAFARAHGLTPGDRLTVTIKGRRERMRIVGIALSPEYMYQIAPGAIFPDPQRYGVLWMARTPLATAYDMEGAFNDVALTLGAGARAEAVIDRLDLILARYGGLG
ncbi:MAG: ABC transporter permease, partial [Gammaproteobacteria bacterium]|nr:ABC transporter permease [Gammaproteobacteria bacterium]